MILTDRREQRAPTIRLVFALTVCPFTTAALRRANIDSLREYIRVGLIWWMKRIYEDIRYIRKKHFSKTGVAHIFRRIFYVRIIRRIAFIFITAP